LPVGAAIALVWVNTAPDSYFRTAFALDFVVNDVLMVLFFALMMKEVAEATAPGGVLHPWQRAMLPLVAAVGLTVLPTLAFAAVVPWFDEPRLVEGWPVVFATDLALGYFVARVIVGSHPVIPFFLLLAISANAFGMVALALATPEPQLRLGVIGLLMTGALGVAGLLRRLQVKSFWPYVLFAGGLSWCSLYFGGLEPAFALVPVMPFLPHARRDPGFFVDADPFARDALNRFELWCRHPAQLALLLFGLVNAGVPLQALYWGTLSLPVAILLGKPPGLLAGVTLARALGLQLPQGIGWREVVVVGFIASIGFTVALFFAASTVGPGPILSALRTGSLATAVGAAVAIGAAKVLRVGKFAK
jgi:NhaA family Na+:H+ antiporter